MGYEWSGRSVLITGASSGIGRALSLEIARRGARLGLIARRREALEEVSGAIWDGGGRALTHYSDVTDRDSIQTAVAKFQEAHGSIDLLIANAGVGLSTPATRLDAAEVARVVDTNLMGAVNAVAAALPFMIAKNSGHIVAISSLAGFRGLPGTAAYCASKAALSTFFESLRLDLLKTDIKVTVINPGYIKTPMTEGGWEHMPFLMELDDATGKILRAIEKGRRTCSFPWQLAMVVRLARLLPDALYDRLAGSVRISPRR